MGIRVWVYWIAAALSICGSVFPLAAVEKPLLSARITSPLGRVGMSGTIRIVAQVQASETAVLEPIRFYVDGTLLQTDSDGPPYAAEWVDENPFERREITVEVKDDLGNSARDTVILEPVTISEVSEVTSVLLEAAVQDKKGRFVSGLTASEFLLHEDGVRQQLEMVAQEAVPATFALLIDSSQSMSRRIDFVRLAAARLTRYLRQQDRMLVAPFSKTVENVTGPTNDPKTVTEAIASIRPRGGTAIYDAVVSITERLSSAEGRRAIVLITDGYDEHSVQTVESALQAVEKARVTLYVVGIGGVAGVSLKGERVLKRLATKTGGRAFFPPREDDLVAVHDVLAADAQNQYLLSYTPMNQKVDGAWRKISLATVSGDYTIRTRAGYFAPKPPPVRASLEFTATDRDRRHVTIAADDLMIVEDGVEQQVDSFHEAVLPVSIVLALDASGSMRGSAAQTVEAARSFVESVDEKDALGIVLFSDRSLFAHDLSTRRQSSVDAISGYHAAGGTALYDALADSLLRLKRAEGRRVVVVVTDGRDENNAGTGPGSQRTFSDVEAQLRETGAIVFSIGLGSKVNRQPLERLAQLSGGEAYFPADVSSLRDEFRTVVENLRRRYIVGYTSTNSRRDGSWRHVQIRSRSSNIQIASPDGYFAPQR